MSKAKTFIIQQFDKEITSDKTHEIRDNLDGDYKYMVGIAISCISASNLSVLEILKVAGKDILPENMEAIHLMSSDSVEPNKRFFSWFEAVPTNGDEITLRFHDPKYNDTYNLQVHVLLTNEPEKLRDVLHC